MPTEKAHRVRLILGDQLNALHPWFKDVDREVLFVMMEMRQETDHVAHHIQKVLCFFAAMRRFAKALEARGHRVLYLTLEDPRNTQELASNLEWIIVAHGAQHFAYQLPDAYRLDQQLKAIGKALRAEVTVSDSHHFLTTRKEVGELFRGKKQYLMERFYRHMRERTGILMKGDEPIGGKWNYDQENRQRPPKVHVPPAPLFFDHDLRDIHAMIREQGVRTIGTVDPQHVIWPLDRAESLALLDHFCEHLLPSFGRYQDAILPGQWAMYHARISFSLNAKMISPMEVCERAVAVWQADPKGISLAQIEGFVRQVIGWREYIRGLYWDRMPAMADMNFFGHEAELPAWYWTGETDMACLRDAVGGSLKHAYAHHIQRLMVTGNFALLAGAHPDAVDAWYLGIYIDAIEWVELPNTRGMSQFADGGIVGTKPYVSSGSYLNKMGHHCGSCRYDVKKRTGPDACPFNALYWHFFARNRERLESGDARPGTMQRIGMVYRTWEKMDGGTRHALLDQAERNLAKVDRL
ncbi:MAG: cryptochrome/photolyase family protein [Flavobacteriales bacterium]|nr:cryptochrome/photolyase family protein [Flavobacteriales bacterium]